jgi:O-antigen/teichoic acid export membrane protein
VNVPPEPSLREHAVEGVKWSTLQILGARTMSLLVFVVLARLLEPTAFGLVSLAAVFVALMQVFIDQGFSQAIVQRADLEPGHLDSAFWSSLLLGSLLTVAGVLSAGLLADLLGQPDLAAVLRWLSLTLVITAVGSTPEAILRRDLAFRSLAFRQLAAAAAGGFVGVGAALTGHGVWSLVAQLIVQAGVGSLVLWIAVPWRPGHDVSWRYFRDLFSFGSNIVAMNIVNFLNRRSDDLMIGVVLGTRALGYYSVGYRILLLLTDVMTRTIESVAFPLFSRVQGDLARLRRGYLMATQVSATIATPVFLGVAALAPELIAVAFGPGWQQAVPVMQVLSLIGILHASLFFNSTVLVATGRPREALFITTVNAVSNVVAFAIAVQWGIVAVAAAYVIRGYLLSPLPVWMVKRVIDFRVREYVRRFAIPLGCALLMVAVMLLLREALRPRLSDLVLIAPVALAGSATYLLAMRLTAERFTREMVDYLSSASPALARLFAWRPPWRQIPLGDPDG